MAMRGVALPRLTQVAIIVLNWNGLDDTPACLASLHRLIYPAYQVVVVDNGSTDGSATALRAEYPGVPLIETGRNLGYVGGNNVGLTWAMEQGADYALLLNNDTEVAPDFLSQLVTVAEADPSVGIVGPTIYYFDRPQVIWSAGGAIDWMRGETRMIGLDEVDTGQFGCQPHPVDFVTGCALLIKMPSLARAGLLDPRFFAYYEEVEWCVRVARAGFQILHVPQAKIWHKISPAAQATSPTVHYYMTRNRLLFLRATHAGRRAWAHTLLDNACTLVSWSLRPKWREKRRQRDVMLQALVDYFVGHVGQATLNK
jgi:GT2 family glycosyltransferase